GSATRSTPSPGARPLRGVGAQSPQDRPVSARGLFPGPPSPPDLEAAPLALEQDSRASPGARVPARAAFASSGRARSDPRPVETWTRNPEVSFWACEVRPPCKGIPRNVQDPDRDHGIHGTVIRSRASFAAGWYAENDLGKASSR